MKANRICLNVIFIVFLLLAFGNTNAEVKIQRKASDHYELIFSGSPPDFIRILQVTDLHLGNKDMWQESFQTVNRVKKFVKRFDPHFIMITGDLFTGKKADKEYLIAFATQFFDDLDRPWLYVFGNHDVEGGTSRQFIASIMQGSVWGVIGSHQDQNGVKYDYQVDLKVQESPVPVWEIYAFDSGSERGNKSIKDDQILWFKEKSSKSLKNHSQKIPAIAIFHIPLKQYQDLWDDSTLQKTGFCYEKVCNEEDNGSVYIAFVEQGNIRACFCGHDHDNNYWGKYHGGILLVYGHVSGDSGYHRHWPPGAKLITLPVKGDEIFIQDMILPDEEH